MLSECATRTTLTIGAFALFKITVNGLEFDDFGNLLFQVGGNTNAGVMGALSSSYLQKEGTKYLALWLFPSHFTPSHV